MSAAVHVADQDEQVRVNKKTCSACGRCAQICPMDVFRRAEDGRPVVLYPEDCSACMLCVTDCPTGSISVAMRVPGNVRSIYDYLNIDLVPFKPPSSE